MNSVAVLLDDVVPVWIAPNGMSTPAPPFPNVENAAIGCSAVDINVKRIHNDPLSCIGPEECTTTGNKISTA